jgi:hypothetical protein
MRVGIFLKIVDCKERLSYIKVNKVFCPQFSAQCFWMFQVYAAKNTLTQCVVAILLTESFIYKYLFPLIS